MTVFRRYIDTAAIDRSRGRSKNDGGYTTGLPNRRPKVTRKLPKPYLKFQKQHPAFFEAWDAIGTAVRAVGPLDPKTAQLLQLAASAAIRSEGAVHSHVRRSLEAGATTAEIRQALMLTAPTIGFPSVVAALTWAEDVLGAKG
jgi:AhpD family alkylhydroperoxidase